MKIKTLLNIIPFCRVHLKDRICKLCSQIYEYNNVLLLLLLLLFCQRFVYSNGFCPRYIPVLMAQAKIYWDLENFAQVEKVKYM